MAAPGRVEVRVAVAFVLLVEEGFVHLGLVGILEAGEREERGRPLVGTDHVVVDVHALGFVRMLPSGFLMVGPPVYSAG
jgi:hypothetical protein